MYFSLPTSQERLQHQQQQQQQQRQIQQQQEQEQEPNVGELGLVDTSLPPNAFTSNSTIHPIHTTTVPSNSLCSSPPNMNFLTDERLVEIVENLEDHWRSPPILTPTTLAMIFNNRHGEVGSPFPPSRSTTATTSTSEKDVISTASLQCFLSQLQKTAALHIPTLEKVIKEDTVLTGLRDGNPTIPPLGALDHLTQVLATFNQKDQT